MQKIFMIFSLTLLISLEAFGNPLQIDNNNHKNAELVDDVFFEYGMGDGSQASRKEHETFFVARDAKSMDLLWEYREDWNSAEGNRFFSSPLRKNNRTFVIRSYCPPRSSCQEEKWAELLVFNAKGRIEERTRLNLESKDNVSVFKLEWLPNGNIAIFASWRSNSRAPYQPMYYIYNPAHVFLENHKIDIPIARYLWSAEVVPTKDGFLLIYAFHDIIFVDKQLNFVSHVAGFDPDRDEYSTSVDSRILDSRVLSNGNIVTITRRYVVLEPGPYDLYVHVVSPKGQLLAKQKYTQFLHTNVTESAKILELDGQVYLVGIDAYKYNTGSPEHYFLFQSKMATDGSLSRLITTNQDYGFFNTKPLEFRDALLLYGSNRHGIFLEKRDPRTFEVLKRIESSNYNRSKYYHLNERLEVLDSKLPTGRTQVLYSPMFNMAPGDSFWVIFNGI